jgi:hypothetical protein
MNEQPQFRCNICGARADFVFQLELVQEDRSYYILHSRQLSFYLCNSHECIYKKMQGKIELKDYFEETIEENQ